MVFRRVRVGSGRQEEEARERLNACERLGFRACVGCQACWHGCMCASLVIGTNEACV